MPAGGGSAAGGMVGDLDGLEARYTGMTDLIAARYRAMRAAGPQPVTLEVVLPEGWPPRAGARHQLQGLTGPDGRAPPQAPEFVAAVRGHAWTVRRVGALWVLGTPLTEAAALLWDRMNSDLEPFDDLTLHLTLLDGPH